MADIFISYAHEDHRKAWYLVQALEEQGWHVFWDREVPAGETWRSYIGKALEEAACVVVAWSRASIKSQFVPEEATLSKQRGVLVPVKFEPVDPPLGFGEIQAADLIGWTGAKTDPAFQRLAQDISRVLGRPPTPEELPTEPSAHGAYAYMLYTKMKTVSDVALGVLLRAVGETKRYVADLDQGQPIDRDRQMELSQLWYEAAIKIRHSDAELAKILARKGGYWAVPEKWDENDLEGVRWGVDKVEKLVYELLNR